MPGIAQAYLYDVKCCRCATAYGASPVCRSYVTTIVGFGPGNRKPPRIIRTQPRRWVRSVEDTTRQPFLARLVASLLKSSRLLYSSTFVSSFILPPLMWYVSI